ncbi:MAG: hypothetical protein EPO28_06355 [Saprospiraceae bacterium]|nr:MAG: hypothetical protein EPO28_06355 [Saprospiraceae bacterium]
MHRQIFLKDTPFHHSPHSAALTPSAPPSGIGISGYQYSNMDLADKDVAGADEEIFSGEGEGQRKISQPATAICRDICQPPLVIDDEAPFREH